MQEHVVFQYRMREYREVCTSAYNTTCVVHARVCTNRTGFFWIVCVSNESMLNNQKHVITYSTVNVYMYVFTAHQQCMYISCTMTCVHGLFVRTHAIFCERMQYSDCVHVRVYRTSIVYVYFFKIVSTGNEILLVCKRAYGTMTVHVLYALIVLRHTSYSIFF